MIATLLLAFGLVLIVEGLVYALAPSIIEQMLLALKSLPIDARRLLGLTSLAIGVVIVWIAKSMGA